ncbi:hypothetical protein LWE61_10870 [Sphingobium sufflavum]|uniref:hypothetical protein n=1 Tax=Sphingobium sufflavum TaxID=1129547 RepID=UPI001F363657|nr:hypothetical protein [Sphingobium sufflavum]MCE7797059.1 hypothetical protein [Sphingobium sufflavum]
MNEILGFLALCGIMAAVGASLLGGGKRLWPTRKTALLAALPVPVVFTVLCLFVFGRAYLAPPERCGANMCGMAMDFAVIGLFWAVIGYGIGLGTAVLVVRKRRAGQDDA